MWSSAGAAKPVAWFHAIVIAYTTDFDFASAMTATCFRCRKGPAEPDIDRDDTKRGRARSVRYRGQIFLLEGTLWDLPRAR